jgi:hypothetical protein
MNVKRKVSASVGKFEELIGKIPGYKGYKQKELRREADKLLRTTLANQLSDLRTKLTGLQLDFLSKGKLALVDDLERAVGKLQILIDRLRTASYGYAGLFDAVKIKEGELDALYDFDTQLLTFVPRIDEGIAGVATALKANGDLEGAIAGLTGVLQEMDITFDHRQEAILKTEEPE